MALKPRIKVISPTPDVSPGSTGGVYSGFSGHRPTAQQTPIRLRITDDVEQKMMFWLNWKSTDSITVQGLQVLDGAMRKRLFERAPLRVVLNGEESDYAALVAAIKAEYPAVKTLAYVNTQKIAEGTRVVSRLFQHFLDNQTTELVQTVSGGPRIEDVSPDRLLWVDITVTAAVNYLKSRLTDPTYSITHIIDDNNVDGIAIDSLRTELAAYNSIVGGAAKDAAWPLQARAVVQGIDGSLDLDFGTNTKEIWFNGLWNQLQDAIDPLEFNDFTFTADHVTDNLTAASHGRRTGDGPVQVSSSILLPSPLAAAPANYWVIWVDIDTFRLAANINDAFAGSQIDLLNIGTGTHTLTDTADTERAGQLKRQELALLPLMTGASVEFFGRSGLKSTAANYWGGADGFDFHTQDIGAVITANLNTPILVRGAVPDAYYHYVPDLQNARYAYACYLALAWTPASTFQFHHNFQIPRLPQARSHGMTVHSYLDLPLSAPLGVAVEIGGGAGGLSREFEGGWVYLAPDGKGTQDWTLTMGLWTPQGQALISGTPITVAQGDALILLKDEPAPHPYRLRATVAESSSEWILETVTSEFRYRRLKVRIRSVDPGSCLLVRAQVNETDPTFFDENHSPRPFGMLRVMPAGGTFTSPAQDYAYGMTPYRGAEHKIIQSAYVTDGQWCDLNIDLREAFDFGTVDEILYFQIHSIRAVGALDVESLELLDPESVLLTLGPTVASFVQDTLLLEVTFHDNSTLPPGTTIASRFWDYGDGITSISEVPADPANPVHVYELAGAKSVTLTVIDSNGAEATYSAIAVPNVDTDGLLKVAFPESQSDFIATGLMPAQHSWNFGMASGGADDQIGWGGSLDLTANSITLYQQSTGVVGWQKRTGVRFTETTSQRFRSTSFPDTAVVDTMLVAVVFLQTPASPRSVMALGTSPNTELRQLGAGIARIISGGNTADGTEGYDGDVFLLSLTNRASASIAEYETSLSTPSAVNATWAASTVTNGGFGDIGGAGSFKGVLLHGWLWKARTFTADVSTNELTLTDHGLRTVDGPVRVYTSGGTLPSGLIAATDYWVIRTSSTTIKLAASANDAEEGVPIDLTSAGSGTNYLNAIPSFEEVAAKLHWVEEPIES